MKYALLFLLSFALILSACEESKPKTESQEKPKIKIAKEASGYELSKKYCVTCHVYPKPEMLDTWTWKNVVLPQMGMRYGIYEDEERREMEFSASTEEGKKIIEEAQVFPKEALMDRADWEKIKSYYLNKSKKDFELPKRIAIPERTDLFAAKFPSELAGQGGAVLVEFDADERLIVSESKGTGLKSYKKGLKLEKEDNVAIAISHRQKIDGASYLLSMGQVFTTDDLKGALIRLEANGKTKVLIDKLQRPVHASYADFDQDGKLDVLISEFGYQTGQLSLFLNQGSDEYKRKKLNAKPGSMRSVIRDINSDSIPDVVVLSAQGDEGITAYINDGNANFTSKSLLRFPPMYGSSYFEFVDLNGDDLEDIIYTCGDNADYDPILKPYHGVYGYINKGDYRFSQLFFEYLNGAYSAKVSDFDKDGDLDVAAISFFPDFKDYPQESFVFLENQGNWNFKKSSIPEYSNGRWLTMDMGDWDEDGDDDLVLSHMWFPAYPENKNLDNYWQQNAKPFMLLENIK